MNVLFAILGLTLIFLAALIALGLYFVVITIARVLGEKFKELKENRGFKKGYQSKKKDY